MPTVPTGPATRAHCKTQGRTGYAGATVVIVPFDPRYLSSPSSTYNIPPPAGFTDGGTDALAIAITPCPAPNWLVVLKPMLPPAASRSNTTTVSKPVSL